MFSGRMNSRFRSFAFYLGMGYLIGGQGGAVIALVLAGAGNIWAWWNSDKAVLDHLKAENAWFEQRMAGQQGRIDALFKEMRARIKEGDKSVPQ